MSADLLTVTMPECATCVLAESTGGNCGGFLVEPDTAPPTSCLLGSLGVVSPSMAYTIPEGQVGRAIEEAAAVLGVPVPPKGGRS